jgi:hypothetical protein
MEEPVLTLTEALGVLAIRTGISFNDYRILGEWLECYTYIPPAQRYLRIGHNLIAASNYSQTCALDWFKHWLLCDIIQCTLTEQQQTKVMQWILDSDSSAIPRS